MSLKATLRPDWRQAAEPRIALVSIHVLMAWLRQGEIVKPPVPVMAASAERLRFDRLAAPQSAPAAPPPPQAVSVPAPPQDRWAMSRDFSLPVRAVAVRRPNFTVSPELLAADAKQERWQYQITKPTPAPLPPPPAVMTVAPLLPPPLPPPSSLPSLALPPPRVLPAYAGEAFADDVYDDLFDAPAPKPEPVRLLSLIDSLPDRLTGSERTQGQRGGSPGSSLGRILAFGSVAVLLLGTAGYFWLR